MERPMGNGGGGGLGGSDDDGDDGAGLNKEVVEQLHFGGETQSVQSWHSSSSSCMSKQKVHVQTAIVNATCRMLIKV